MKMTLVFVPVDGGETEYALDYDLPGVPQDGDYISVLDGEGRRADFIVRRTWWQLNDPGKGVGKAESILVECEYAKSPYSSESHLRRCESLKITRNGPVKEFDDTMF